MWSQNYDPFRSMLLSTLAAGVPVVVLLGLLAFHVRAHLAAVIGLISALAVAIFAFGMPAKMAGLAAGLGALFGSLPIGWIVLNIIFLHRLTEENGSLKVLQESIAHITNDRREPWHSCLWVVLGPGQGGSPAWFWFPHAPRQQDCAAGR